MKIKFYKYQGTGNDFIIVQDRDGSNETLLKNRIEQLCNRRFGIGADGFIFIQDYAGYDFYMRYYNSDGKVSSMCGNGGRCVISLANKLGTSGKKLEFMAADGPHSGYIDQEIINLKMANVGDYRKIGADYVLGTGSPHYVRFVENFNDVDIVLEGKKVRYSSKFREDGINVNFVEITNGEIKVATYERGVEGETLSCGTGVTAAALASKLNFPDKFNNSINVISKGGNLVVKFEYNGNIFKNVWLSGPAVNTFVGEINI